MQSISLSQAKKHFSALLKQIEKGKYIVITKYGHAVAKLVPVTEVNPACIHKAIQRLQEFAKSNKLEGLSWKDLRDENRR